MEKEKEGETRELRTEKPRATRTETSNTRYEERESNETKETATETYPETKK